MFRLFILAGVAGFAVSASCMSVVSPASGSELDLSRMTKVEWSDSSSDPSAFNLYLFNRDLLPSVNLKIASNLTTSKEEYTFDGVDVLPGSGYLFNFKDASSGDILAQSGEFSVVSHGSNTTTSSAASTATNTSTTAPSTETSTGAAAHLSRAPLVVGAMSVLVGMMCSL